MAGPHEAFIRGFPEKAETAPYATDPFLIDLKLNDRIGHAWIYRYVAGMDSEDFSWTKRQFKRAIDKVLAA